MTNLAGSRTLKIDRAIYVVDESTKTYSFSRRNLRWRELSAAENQRNKRHLDGYTRIFPTGARAVFHYRPPYTTPSAGGTQTKPNGTSELEELHRTVYSFISQIDALPSRDKRPARWGAREVLSHLAFWHEHYVKLLRAHLAGKEPRLPVATFNELNAFAVEKFRQEPLDAIAARFIKAQTKLERLAEDRRTSAFRIRIKAGAKGWPWTEFLRRVDGHIRGHASWLRARNAVLARPAASRGRSVQYRRARTRDYHS